MTKERGPVVNCCVRDYELINPVCVRDRNSGELDRSKSRSRRSFEPSGSAFRSIKVASFLTRTQKLTTDPSSFLIPRV
jgi:hypothetical protein